MNKFDPTKPYQTRDGRKAQILKFNCNGPNNRSWCVLVTDRFGEENAFMYREGGSMDVGSVTFESYDLVNIPESDLLAQAQLVEMEFKKLYQVEIGECASVNLFVKLSKLIQMIKSNAQTKSQ